jgi:hypothetical protein
MTFGNKLKTSAAQVNRILHAHVTARSSEGATNITLNICTVQVNLSKEDMPGIVKGNYAL